MHQLKFTRRDEKENIARHFKTAFIKSKHCIIEEHNCNAYKYKQYPLRLVLNMKYCYLQEKKEAFLDTSIFSYISAIYSSTHKYKVNKLIINNST